MQSSPQHPVSHCPWLASACLLISMQASATGDSQPATGLYNPQRLLTTDTVSIDLATTAPPPEKPLLLADNGTGADSNPVKVRGKLHPSVDSLPSGQSYFSAAILAPMVVAMTLPRLGFGTTFNGITEVDLGHSQRRLRGHGLGIGLEWWSDERLWDTIDSLESLAGSSVYSSSSIAPSILGSLDALYEEDYQREIDYWEDEDESWGSDTVYGGRIYLGYVDVDGDASAYEPIGGNNVANTYLVPNPDNGSTGLFLGSLGMDIRAISRVSQYRANLGFFMQRGLFGGLLRSGVRFGYDRLAQQHQIYMTSPSFPSAMDLSSETRYDVDEDRLSLGGEVSHLLPVGKKAWLDMGVGADAVYRSAKLDAWQRNRAGVLGPSHPEYDFTVQSDDDDSGVSFNLDARLKMGFRITRNSSLTLGLGAQYMNDVARVETRETPSAPEAHLRTGDALSYYAQAGYYGRF